MLKSMAIIASVSSVATAQQAVYSNASASPAVPALAETAVSANGTPAPTGGLWSEVQAAGFGGDSGSNALAGVACHTDSAGGVRLADNFVVPEGQSWNLDQLWVYVYEPGFTGGGSPVASGTVRVWYGNPTAGGQVVWGDTTTNRLASTTATTTYRIFTTEVGPLIDNPGTSRRIHRVVLNTPATLTAGEYWVDWQLTPTTPGAWVFAVPATVNDVRSQPGWNAKAFMDGSWSNVMDLGKPMTVADTPVDIAFILTGTAGAACDSIDYNGDQIFPDATDIADFLTVFAGGPCSTGACGDIDFNNDGLFPDTQDIASLLSVFSGGACL